MERSCVIPEKFRIEFLWNGIVFCDAESGLGRGGLHFPN